MTPLILLDIDGCLNAYQAHPALNRHLRRTRAGSYSVILDDRHPEWMRELEQRGDVRWATMWQENAAPQFGAVAGFGQDWDYVDFDSHHPVRAWRRYGQSVVHYKMPGILAVLGDDQPLVYVDDDMCLEHHDWAMMRSEAGIPTLFIQPDPAFGFTREQYEEILYFLDNVAAENIAA